MRLLKKIGLWLAGGLLALGILGGLAAPPLVKSLLTDKLGEKLHRVVAIQNLRINPYTLSATVEGFSVHDKNSTETLFGFDQLYVNLSAASLWNRAPVLEEIRLQAPYLRIARISEQRYNISDLLDEFMQPRNDPPARFSLNNIQVIDGRIDFDDQPHATKHKVDGINLTLPFISSLPYFADKYVEPGFSARINGTPVALKGKSRPFSDTRETVLDLHEENLDLTKYVEYIPLDLKVRLASGLLDSKLSLTFAQQKDQTPRVGLSGTAALKNVAVNKPGGDFLLRFSRLDTEVRSFDLAKRNLSIGNIQLAAPELNLLRNRTGEIDAAGLLAPTSQTRRAEKPADAEAPFVVQVAEVRVNNGRIAFGDESVSPEFRTELKDIGVTARDFSSDGKRPMQWEASLAADGGSRLQANGRLTVSPLAGDGKFALAGIQPKSYAPYYRNAVLLDIEDGTADVASGYRFAQASNGPEILLGGLSVKLENLRLKKRGEKADFLSLPLLEIGGAEIDSAKQSFSIGELVSQNAKLNISRNARGEFSLASLTPAKSAARPDPAAKPWAVAIKKLDLNGYAVNFEDRSLSTPARFMADNVALNVENFSTAKDSKASASLKLRMNKRGTLQVAGSVALEPVAANLKVDARNLDLVALQPYFADKVKITLVSGAAIVKGAVAFRQQGNTPQFGFNGDIGIISLHTIDKANASDFLKWKSLAVRGIKARGLPLDVNVGEIALKDFYSRLIVNADGKLNLQQILVTEGETPDSGTTAPPQAEAKPATAPPPADSAPDYKIRIGGITLAGGSVDFSDRFIKPNYSANLTDIGGTVAALSSDPATRAEVKLTGRVNNDAPLDITGAINPLSKTLYLDLAASAKGIELSPLTPYAAKYAGYGIEKGKLSLDIKYHIEEGKLTADNKIFLEQLTFGQHIDSPTATKLPVLLAVALLKDRNGNIDINLPVSGSLNDPQFSIGGLIFKVIINLLVKVATSPFALLGAVFGGGDELNTIDFDQGRTAITAASEAKLKSVAKALTDRPALKLEITGHAATTEDAEPAKKAALEKKIRAQKLALSAKEGASVDENEPVKISPGEYPKLLEAVYKQEKFAKPKNLIGFSKSLPPEEMEKLILTNTRMSDEDLTELATTRARAVRDWLVAKGQVPAERVFLVASKLGGGGSEKAAKATRVDLSLK